VKLVAILAAGAIACSASAAANPWQPSMAAAVGYASHRHGVMALAVRTPTGHWGWHATRIFRSASVGSGWVDHRVALLTRGDERLSVAILTQSDGSHAYEKQTLRGIAVRLLRGLG
jgi:hypothetical protein